MAIKEDKSFTGTQIGYRSLLLEKGHGVNQEKHLTRAVQMILLTGVLLYG